MKAREAPLPQLLTPAEVARICRVSLRTARRWIADGEIKVHRLQVKIVNNAKGAT